jgi:hypothetical protein
VAVEKQLTSLGDDEDQRSILGAGELDRNAAAHLEWLPDFDFVDITKTFKTQESDLPAVRLQEEMTFHCIIDSAGRLSDLEACNWHFDKFRNWLHVEIVRAHSWTYLVLKPKHVTLLIKLPQAARDARTGELFS